MPVEIPKPWFRNAKSRASLPPRVQNAIRCQQESSEILISWVQLGVALTFLLLYTLAPKTFTQEAPFEPVPWALGLYLVGTVGRLWLAYQRRLPNWGLYASAIGDLVLLYCLIWSFHLQYEQPASFYLKVPTLLYAFIFIALRTLHFEARFVIVAGAAAGLGWLAMVFYAIYFDTQAMPITRDYVEYITSNSVLLGAEFDKIISIFIVTCILAVAIMRARELLESSIVESSTAQGLSRFVPIEVVDQIKHSETALQAGQGEEQEATILFADLEKFTSLSEAIEPTDVINTLNEYFAAVAVPLEQYGGVITQFQGDAILASFNLPRSHSDHARNAIQAALAIQEILDSRYFGKQQRLRARIGINTGRVVGGLVGTPDRLNYTVHSDAVNLAARLESLNKEYGTSILISNSTRLAAPKEAFIYRALGEVQIRGRHSLTPIYTVLRSA